MSIQNKIRSIKLNNNIFDVYIVFPEDGDSFNIPYVMAIPENIKEDSKLIVESNNIERRNNGKNLDFDNSSDRQYIIDDAISDVIGNKRAFGKIEYADLVSAPMIMPVIPTTATGVPYFQQLSEECFNNKIAGEKYSRIDKQVIGIIDDVKSKIFKEKNILLAEKIFLMGYSSSGVFAQRFAMLAPELVDTLLVGGALGSVPEAADSSENNQLDYPLGCKNYRSITGKKFNEEEYKKIKFNYYVAENEDIPKATYSYNEFGRKAPMHDMSYMSRSVPKEVGKKQREVYGINMWDRFQKILKLYKNKGYDFFAKVIKGKYHKDTQISNSDFEAVYNGKAIDREDKSFKKPLVIIRTINGIKRVGNFLLKKFKQNNKSKLLDSGNKEYYRQIDDIDVDSLSKDFESEVRRLNLDKKINDIIDTYKPIIQNGKILNYGIKIKISQKDVAILTQRFFEYISEEYGRKTADILLGNSARNDGKQYIGFSMYKFDPNHKYYFTKYDLDEKGFSVYEEVSCVTVPKGKNNDIKAYVTLSGDIGDLYDTVHELTHTFDSKNGDTTTRMIMGEVLPQIMERQLDEFLLNLSDEELLKFGINRNDLESDVKLRRMYSFISRYNNACSLNKNCGDKIKDRRYVLALMCSTEFMKGSSELRRKNISKLVHAVLNDDINKYQNILGIDLRKENSIGRQLVIQDTIDSFSRLVIDESEVKEEANNRLQKRNLEGEKINFYGEMDNRGL